MVSGGDKRSGTPITLSVGQKGGAWAAQLPRVRVRVQPSRGEAVEAELGLTPLVVGSGDECGLQVKDASVSRRHCRLTFTQQGVIVEDLASKNGVEVAGVQLLRAVVTPGVSVRLGAAQLTLHLGSQVQSVALSKGASFGAARGASIAMRALFAQLERAAGTEQPILLIGESGTGKDLLAHGVHDHSARRDGPFVVFDCGAVAASLIEAELFGFVRGAFTGADRDRAGLLEQSNGGTLFLDEIGELPAALQPRLLRALETGRVRRLGSNAWSDANARVVAATNRDLRAELKKGAFREDLYYRLAVVEVTVPPLRDRKDDIPVLVEHFLAQHEPKRTLADLPAHTLDLLKGHDWPGNVRELKNVITRLVLFPEAGLPPVTRVPSAGTVRLDLSLREGRELAVEAFERAYLKAQLERHKGNVTAASKTMGLSRQFVHRLLARYDIRSSER